MDELVSGGTSLLSNLGVWVAFIFTLMIFSALVGDNAISRLAQHILVGTGLGYAAILALRHVLYPRLLAPIQSGDAGLTSAWIPLALSIVLLVAGFDRTILQSSDRITSVHAWRRGLHSLGRMVVALLLGIGLGAGIMGTLQGTLVPQYLRAAQTGFSTDRITGGPFVGVITLVLTTATILHLYIRPDKHLSNLPDYAKGLLTGWIWIGQRALWFASGLIFARLVASRLSLLIARIVFLTDVIQDAGFW